MLQLVHRKEPSIAKPRHGRLQLAERRGQQAECRMTVGSGQRGAADALGLRCLEILEFRLFQHPCGCRATRVRRPQGNDGHRRHAAAMALGPEVAQFRPPRLASTGKDRHLQRAVARAQKELRGVIPAGAASASERGSRSARNIEECVRWRDGNAQR